MLEGIGCLLVMLAKLINGQFTSERGVENGVNLQRDRRETNSKNSEAIIKLS